MTRRDELAAVRERSSDPAAGLSKTTGPVEMGSAIAVIAADRRFLLGVVDELAAALQMAIDWEELVGGEFDRKYPDCPTGPRQEPADWYVAKLRALLSDVSR